MSYLTLDPNAKSNASVVRNRCNHTWKICIGAAVFVVLLTFIMYLWWTPPTVQEYKIDIIEENPHLIPVEEIHVSIREEIIEFTDISVPEGKFEVEEIKTTPNIIYNKTKFDSDEDITKELITHFLNSKEESGQENKTYKRTSQNATDESNSSSDMEYDSDDNNSTQNPNKNSSQLYFRINHKPKVTTYFTDEEEINKITEPELNFNTYLQKEFIVRSSTEINNSTKLLNLTSNNVTKDISDYIDSEEIIPTAQFNTKVSSGYNFSIENISKFLQSTTKNISYEDSDESDF